MRVLIAAGFIGKYGESDGVVTTYQNLLPRFIKAGDEVDLVAYGNEDSCEEYGPVRVIVHKPRIPLQVDPIRWIDGAVIQTGWLRELANRRYDVVQSSTPDTLGLWAYKLARKQNTPLLLLYHTALDQYAEIRFQKIFGNGAGKAIGLCVNRWLNWYYNQADLVLAPSKAIKEELEKTIMPVVGILSRGVNADKFHPRFRNRNGSKIQAIYVGRVAPEKNLKLLVDLFAKRTDVELVVVGDGPYLEEMKEKLPNSTFTGRLIGEDLSSAYANADFFIFPSKTDTLGNVVNEAMSSGIPAIVSDTGGPKELVNDGITGYIAKTDTDFEDSVNRFVNDTSLRKTMGLAARKSAELRSWDSIYSQLRKYHEDIHSLQTTLACCKDM